MKDEDIVEIRAKARRIWGVDDFIEWYRDTHTTYLVGLNKEIIGWFYENTNLKQHEVANFLKWINNYTNEDS